MKVLGDPGTGLLPAGVGGSGRADDQQLTAIEAILREGLAQGAVAVGFGSAYTPGAPISEIERMFRVAAAAGMTEIQSALFDDWRDWPDERFALHQLVSTGERLTRVTFGQARAAGGTVIIHGRSEAQTRAAIASPLSMIASDGFIEKGRGHPRTSGTYAKVLGQYVREEQAMTVMEALRKMTLDPARRLETRVPAMRNKGRIRVGADADLTVFNPATVIDRATYEDASLPSAGSPS
jgi:dihydroorotase